MPTLRINEGPEGGSIEDIPQEQWDLFLKNSKEHFPKEGENAWAAVLSEVILSIAGGTDKSVTTFMTDIPRANADALADVLSQVNLTWDRFYAYMLNAALKNGHIQIANFPDKPEQMGMLIVLGIRPHVFSHIEKNTGHSLTSLVAGIIQVADNGGTITYTGPEKVD